MKSQEPSAAGNHRHMIIDMVELTVRGTVAAVAIAALAMGLIALAAG